MSASLYTVFGEPPQTIAPWLLGVPPATLQTWLAAAQQAYQDCAIGNKPRTVSYAQGQGQRSVTYSPATLAQLTVHIRQINAALGNIRPRRGLAVRF